MPSEETPGVFYFWTLFIIDYAQSVKRFIEFKEII